MKVLAAAISATQLLRSPACNPRFKQTSDQPLTGESLFHDKPFKARYLTGATRDI